MKHWLELKIDRVDNFSIESSIETSSNNLDKKLKTKIQIENHANLLKLILKIKNSMVFYTDGAKNLVTTGATMIRLFNGETKAENWNSERYIDVIDVELFAIKKQLNFAQRKHIQSK